MLTLNAYEKLKLGGKGVMLTLNASEKLKLRGKGLEYIPSWINQNAGIEPSENILSEDRTLQVVC